MRIRTIGLAAAILALGLTAQPLYDIVHVTLPYSVTIGQKTLSPGDYTIEQQRSENSPVLLIYNGDGMKFQTSVMTIKALDNKTPEDTSVILHHIGDDYYLDKVWIQGKNYGYEIPLPGSVKERAKEMAAVSVPATATSSSTSSAPTDTTNTAAATATTDNTSTNSDTAPPPVVDNSTQPPPTPEPTVSTLVTPEPQMDQQPEPTPATSDNTVSTDTESANREKRAGSDDTSSMPATSAGWLMMLLGGGTLSSAGMMLRRKR